MQLWSVVLPSTVPGIIILIAGLLLKFKPPKNRNFLYGYRTKRSMVSESSWIEANSFSSLLMIYSGISDFIIAFLCGYFSSTNSAVAILISIVWSVVSVIATIPITEYHLSKISNKKDI
jgi:uncharacterized membrane protein